MISPKISKSIRIVAIVLVIVLTLSAGLLLGYRFIINQNKKMDLYERQVAQAKDLATAEPTPTPYPTETDEDGNVLEPTDEDGNPIETVPVASPTPTLKVDEKDEVVLNSDSPGAVMIHLDTGDSTVDIARKLKESKVIDDTTLFTIFSKVNGFDGGYQAGTHFVRAGMSYDQLMFILTQAPVTKNIRLRDDFTTDDIKQVLKKNGIFFDDAEFDKLLNDVERFKDYDFIAALPMMQPGYKPDPEKPRDSILQGYLFPDTYRFDLKADAETVIRTCLNNFERRIDEKYYERAAYLGMSMDQVITLASIIQKESGNIADMYKISRVFHNRLHDGIALQSDVTVNYFRNKEGKESLPSTPPEDFEKPDYFKEPNPYNTYYFKGLPPGPICSPALAAIEAALYPDTQDMELYYFVATPDGRTIFAHTYEEHLANIEAYWHSRGGE